MKNFSLILSTVAIVIAAVALISTSKNNKSFDEAKLENALQNNPKLVIDAIETYQYQQQEEQRRAAEEAAERYAHEINNDEYAPSVGAKEPSVTVVEFFDFSCGYCKRLANTVEKLVADNPDVKFVFKPLSFVSPVSKYQAQASMAAHKQGKFIEFYKKVMAFEGRMSEADVDNIAKEIGVDMNKYAEDVKSADVKDSLNKISELAQIVQVNGVPYIFVDGRQAPARDVDGLQAIINNAK